MSLNPGVSSENTERVMQHGDAMPTIVCVPTTLPWLASFYVCSLETGEEAVVVSHWFKRYRVTAAVRRLREAIAK